MTTAYNIQGVVESVWDDTVTLLKALGSPKDRLLNMSGDPGIKIRVHDYDGKPKYKDLMEEIRWTGTRTKMERAFSKLTKVRDSVDYGWTNKVEFYKFASTPRFILFLYESEKEAKDLGRDTTSYVKEKVDPTRIASYYKRRAPSPEIWVNNPDYKEPGEGEATEYKPELEEVEPDIGHDELEEAPENLEDGYELEQRDCYGTLQSFAGMTDADMMKHYGYPDNYNVSTLNEIADQFLEICGNPGLLNTTS